MLEKILDKIDKGIPLTKSEAVGLLKTDNHSGGFYRLLSKANGLSRREYGNAGYVFAQIGINSAPCSGNCKFCSLAKDHFAVDSLGEKDARAVSEEAKMLAAEGISDLFLMTTADYDQEKFLAVSGGVKRVLPSGMRLVANIGDFDLSYAKRLKETGFTGAYHIVRLREGMDTDIPPEKRIATLDAIRGAGLELYYCVEPIGPEHTYEELADEMLRAREYGVDVMAVMRRVGVPGTKFEGGGSVSELEFTKIAAVTRLVTRPMRSMNVHEPVKMALLAGVNQLYAESGINPRDNRSRTELNRGCNVGAVRRMLADAEYTA